MKKRRILVIDDEKAIRETLSEILTDEGYAVTTSASGEEGLRRFLDERWDLILLDVWLKDRDGLSLLEAAEGRVRDVPVVMISGHANVETAVKAVRLGAYDFLEKPLALERVLLTAQKAIERRDLLAEIAAMKGRTDSEAILLGGSAAMTRLRSEIDARGPDGRARAHHGRKRHRQGARGAGPAPPLGTGRRAPGRGQLRRDPGRAHRVGAVRPHQGLLHGSLGGQARQVRRSRRRDAVPGRGRRHVRPHAVQGAARPPGGPLHARRQHEGDRVGRPGPFCDQQGPARPRSPEGRSARTCTSASPSFRSTCRRCASARRTSRSWPATSSSSLRPASAGAPGACHPGPCAPSRPTAGRATCGSSRI